MAVKELCRNGGFSDATFYKWRARFGGMEATEARLLRDVQAENAKLKKLLAEAHLDIEALKVVSRCERQTLIEAEPRLEMSPRQSQDRSTAEKSGQSRPTACIARPEHRPGQAAHLEWSLVWPWWQFLAID